MSEATERTFDELRAMAQTCSHYSHVQEFYYDKYVREIQPDAYMVSWRASQDYYHLSVDRRCYA